MPPEGAYVAVCEDHESHRAVIREVFESRGLRVVFARNPREAEELAKDIKQGYRQYDAVCMDSCLDPDDL